MTRHLRGSDRRAGLVHAVILALGVASIAACSSEDVVSVPSSVDDAGADASTDAKPAPTPSTPSPVDDAGADAKPTPQPSVDAGADAKPAPTSDPYAAARKDCFDRTNAYRARTGVPALSYRADKDACADRAAASDAASGKAHGAFALCGPSAQNECPGWPGPAGSVVAPCLQQMFDEGPGEPYSAHGHYINMTNARYTGVSCGFAQTAGGKIWMVQNFY